MNSCESVIQEAGIPHLASDSGSQVACQGIPAIRLKIIFSKYMEHWRTKVSLLSLYRHFLLHFQKRGNFCLVTNGTKFSHVIHYRLVINHVYGERLEVGLLNNETAYERVLFKKLFYKRMLPSMYSPSPATHYSIHFFHWSKQCWKPSFVRCI